MNLYVENRSPRFFRKAFAAVEQNVKRDVTKVFVVEYRGGFSSKPYRIAKKQGVHNVEYVIFGERGIARAIWSLNRKKNPISLTVVLRKPLSARAKKRILRAEKEFKVIDRTPEGANVPFCNSFANILCKSVAEDQILDADVMHLYRFYETVFQCKFSSCLGKNFFVSRNGTVHFCPEHLQDSLVGRIGDEGNYLESERFRAVLSEAIKKRSECREHCEYFDYCSGACPLEDGCSDFPALFKKNAAEFDRIVSENESLEGKKLAVAKIVVKDAVYPEEENGG